MISETEMPDVCKKLDQLTLDYWHGSKTAKDEYQLTWRAAWLSGFKIVRKRIKDENKRLIGIKHSFRAKQSHAVDVNGHDYRVHCKNTIADLKIVDMRPAGFKTPNGYCTTNAMSQVLPLSFEEIYRKQRKHGSGWNYTYAYRPILFAHGYSRVILRKPLSTFKVADKLFSIKTPFLAESVSHITCIDNRGPKPCVNDMWDSRRCRITSVYVKNADAERAKRMLSKS